MKENNIIEDEIDLKELFKTIWNKKYFILGFTFLVTLLSILYVNMKTPIYEAKALIEIGSYKQSGSNSNIIIDDVNKLSKKLNVLYIDIFKNNKKRESEISSINILKNQNDFIEIVSNGISNELAIKEIKKVIDFIRIEHGNILGDIKKRREEQIDNIDKKINNIKNNRIKRLDERILLQEKTITQYNKQLEIIDKNLKKIEDINPSLAALKLMEKRDINNFILESTIQLMEMKSKKDNLIIVELSRLKEEKSTFESLLLPHNYKQSQVLGKIITNEKPIKPKKALLIVVSFITAFILSIFLVFFIQFIKGFKEEKND